VNFFGGASNNKNALVVAIRVTGKNEETGSIGGVALGVAVLDFPVLEMNSDFPAETGPFHVIFLGVPGFAVKTFHKINRLVVLQVDLPHFGAVSFLKVKEILVWEKVPGFSLQKHSVGIVDDHQIHHLSELPSFPLWHRQPAYEPQPTSFPCHRHHGPKYMRQSKLPEPLPGTLYVKRAESRE
jgi:hypothetical protein